MGVEPTRQNLSTRLIGFEDRGRHPPDYACHKYTNSFFPHVRKESSFSVVGRRWASKTASQNASLEMCTVLIGVAVEMATTSALA